MCTVSMEMRTNVRMTSQGNPVSRFQRALATGNVALVRAAAAAELRRIGVAEAAAKRTGGAPMARDALR